MEPVISFIIPVRHQANAADWPGLKRRLSETIQSISSQNNPNWQAVIVANHGADLPDLPDGFRIEHVSFPPNAKHDIAAFDRDEVYDSFRLDKGRRVLSGMLASLPTRYFMIVDDDDLVSSHITDYVIDHIGANGWKIDKGWVWSEGQIFVPHDRFNDYCGTSLIIRSDLYELPTSVEAASDDYVKTFLGSHVRIGKILADKGAQLDRLPFRGAIYRVGHRGAHSKSAHVLRSQIFNANMLRKPPTLVRNLLGLRFLSKKMGREFFGS
ncbi:MAG: galactosyl transferase [bacterium]|nr:galactosyl transferase [bacterium]